MTILSHKTSTSIIFIITALFAYFTSSAQIQKDSLYYAKLKQPGVKMIPVCNGKYKVFTQKFGNGKIKLLLLHGGPGNGHEYFENFPSQLTKKGITVYYYDQLGSYYSDSPLDSSVFSPAAFVEQVEDVRKGLQLNNFYLLGHSWGGLLAELYSQKYQQHIKGLILSNVPGGGFSAKDKMQKISDSLTDLLLEKTKKLPAFSAYSTATIDSVVNGEQLTDSILFKRLDKQFDRLLDSVRYRVSFYCKNDEEPEPLKRNVQHVRLNSKNKYLANLQYTYHKTADYKAALLSIKINTLLLGSAHDYMFPEGYYDLKTAMTKANVRVYICPNGSHFDMWDDTTNYFSALSKFIADNESGKFTSPKRIAGKK
jgi:proline iminopeptidase